MDGADVKLLDQPLRIEASSTSGHQAGTQAPRIDALNYGGKSRLSVYKGFARLIHRGY